MSNLLFVSNVIFSYCISLLQYFKACSLKAVVKSNIKFDDMHYLKSGW